jgi:hypothetical protein
MSKRTFSGVLLLGVLCLGWSGSEAQPKGSDREALIAQIRSLDAEEARGLLNRDSAALRRLWAPDFTVNNPRNSITRGSEEVVALISHGTIDYSTF